jgi:hypothetical protein
MTPEQRSALRDYILNNPDSVSFAWGGDTKTLDEWAALRNDEGIARTLSDVEVGAALGKTAPRAMVPANELKAAIASGDEFATMPSSSMDKLSWFISSDPFPMSDPTMKSGVERILEPFADTTAKFAALATKPASIAEALLGVAVSTNDVSEALN